MCGRCSPLAKMIRCGVRLTCLLLLLFLVGTSLPFKLTVNVSVANVQPDGQLYEVLPASRLRANIA